jgi:hypothetical protein
LKYLRLTPPPHEAHPSVRMKLHRQSSILSLGRAIVALYIATLLTAVISARTLAENDPSQPGVREIDLQETTYPVLDP